MKKSATLCFIAIIACISCFAATAWGGVSLSAFPDPVFREYLKQYDTGWEEYDSNGERYYTVGRNDGILDDKEIEIITGVSVHGVASLEGIRYLTALEYLHCDDNQMTELNVSGCTALEYLQCYNNQLTELNVSGCTALERLDCYNNQLKELNVSGCAALKYLQCFNNQLTELDISDCIALEDLQCASNQLTELDLTNNTALQFNIDNNDVNSRLWQKARGLKVKKTSKGHYEINMKDYVSRLERIEYSDINYNKGTGIGIISWCIPLINYGYNTGLVISGKSIIMPVKVTNALSIVALERCSTSNTPIICDMTDNSYLGEYGNSLNESSIHNYSYSDYGKLGLAADGNSRVILRVETDKPGTASFSINDDIGIKLESLTSRAELSVVGQKSCFV